MKRKTDPAGESRPEETTQIEEIIPLTYCYNSCGVEKNLRQIRILKDAGLLTQEAYEQRRRKILNRE